MSWECKTVEKQREDFVLAARESGSFSRVCREFGITRKTGYKWIARAGAGEPLSDRSRAPVTVANRTPAGVEEMILGVRAENPGWGAGTIRRVLENEGVTDLPCVKTVNNILKRNGCIEPEESAKRVPFVRFAKEHSNDMWQTDFKGEFVMKNGEKCYPLDILDDSTRFLIGIKACGSTANAVIPAFEEAFREYGLPDSVLSDNGCQFRGFKDGYTSFEKWLMDHDVLPKHGRYRHPQTQGKIERFHRSMKSELLKYREIEDLEDAEAAFRDWREKYNTVRPHEALDMRRPADVYVPSKRTFCERIGEYEYSGLYHVIKVNSWGYLRFGGLRIYLSQTFENERIEVRPSDDGETLLLCYRNFRIGEIDPRTGERLNRKIERL